MLELNIEMAFYEAQLLELVKVVPLSAAVTKVSMLRSIVSSFRNAFSNGQLPERAIAEREADKLGVPAFDPGPDEALRAAIEWLCLAQDSSVSADGGVARDFSLVEGWNSSYPETTGYIIPTLLKYGQMFDDRSCIDRAERMLRWITSIQFPDGGFQGSVIGAEPVIPVTFNTGQILLGLAHGTEAFGEAYREPMKRAADWLVETQDEDGCWRRHRSPFAEPTDKAYETHVSWGLFEAARVGGNRKYADAGIANIRWALSRQNENGWFRDCCLSEPEHPLTHTIGYVLRGVLEAYRHTKDETYLEASVRTADAILGTLRPDGDIPGRLDDNWEGTVDWTCLTGNVQIAACWLMLFQFTGDEKYRDAGLLANKFVRRTVRTDGPPETRGAVKGSFPIWGDYCSYEYPNWAAKFLIDALMLEKEVITTGR